MAADGKAIGLGEVARWMGRILQPDYAFFRLSIIYGIAIALLSLATPISVQLLINSVANTAMPAPLFALAFVLFLLLLCVVGLSALRIHLMARFEQRAFARVVAEITLRAVHAQNPFFQDQRRFALFNRFFDLVTVQKAVPDLLVGGFTIVLTTVVGLIITSFYHQFFLAFNAVLVLCLFAIWQIWVRGAIRTSIQRSHAKHDTAAWLESVGGSNGFYKSSRHLDFAMDRSEEMIAGYVGAHRKHFRYTFSQTLACLLLYAIASSALLALGGWLIIRGELSIGQLVAAELILSAVFYGISQLGVYLEKFYELSASLEELMLLYDIPQESAERNSGAGPANGAIKLRGVEYADALFDFAVESGEQLTVMADPTVDTKLGAVLKRHVHPKRGLVMVGGSDIETFDMFKLRSDIMVFERPTMVEVTIREYFHLSGRENSPEVMDMLELTGLASRFAQLPDGLDTALSSSGRPLSVGETMALKLTMALLTKPRVVVLSALFDLIPPARLAAAMQVFRRSGTTVLHFTKRPEEAPDTDGFLWLGRREQMRVPDADTLIGFAKTGGPVAISS